MNIGNILSVLVIFFTFSFVSPHFSPAHPAHGANPHNWKHHHGNNESDSDNVNHGGCN